MSSTVLHTIVPSSPEAHLFAVSCTIAEPDPGGQQFSMPAWIPGSYLLREFARHVVRIRAHSARQPVQIAKLNKNTWVAEPCPGPLTIEYEVYAFDLSVRGAYLDTTRGFFNGTCVFMRVHGTESTPQDVEIHPPQGKQYKAWRIATAMTRAGAKSWAFGRYTATDYDELIDHPVEMGVFSLASFRAGGVPHEIVISGRHDADMRRLTRDLKKLCETQIAFWREAPMKRYLFLILALGDGYGGLEHRASTSLICSRDSLPRRDTTKSDEKYTTFLGLCSHEYFHTWNVKRIKPEAFTPYDLDHENYTTLLWAFEGITSYYDDLMLVRASLITRDAYLELLGRTITQVHRGAGRLKQSVAESSFDAWTKFYRQDENAPNAIVSYYSKGSLIAFCLDLLMRQKSGGRRSLDHVMRALWKRYGRTAIGVPEDGVQQIAEEIAGASLDRFFDSAIYSAGDLPLSRMLKQVGVELHLRPTESTSDRGGKPASTGGGNRIDLGIRTRGNGNEVGITHVLDGGSAQQTGLAAGDILIAIDGLRVSKKNLEKLLSSHRPGQRVHLHVFRRDELLQFEVELSRPPRDTAFLTVGDNPTQKRSRRSWLGTD
ncbi:MAG: PDZ domain-containing protein [Burkholderiales bacterium]|jgi:predicted metalloprotease with PDZ domain